MKSGLKIAFPFLLALAFVAGCAKKADQSKMPATSPQDVVTRFYQLLSDGGRLSLQEAKKMISEKYGAINDDSFRKWTSDFGSAKSSIKVVSATLPQTPNKKGDWVAVVKMEVKTPSMFDDNFTTTSQVNLILDEKANEWKVDFMGDTIDESGFMAAPQQAAPADGTEMATK